MNSFTITGTQNNATDILVVKATKMQRKKYSQYLYFLLC